MHAVEWRNRGVVPAVIVQQLAAACFEGPQIGIGLIDDGTDLLIGIVHVAVELEDFPIPVGIFEDQVLEEIILNQVLQILRRRIGAGDPSPPLQFAAQRMAGEYLLAHSGRLCGLPAGVLLLFGLHRHQLRLHSFVYLPQAAHLRRRQAILAGTALALQVGDIELTGAWIFEHSIAHTIGCIAGSQNRVVDERQLGFGNETRAVFVNGLRNPVAGGLQMSHVVGGRAGQNSVIVGGIALRFSQCLVPAFRTAVPVRILRGLGVESRHQRLGLQSHLMHGTIAEVHDLRRMPERPFA